VTYRSDASRRAESASDVALGERVRVEQRSGRQDFGCSDPALSVRVAGNGCFPQRIRYSRGGLKRVAASTRSATYDQGPNSGISFPTGICRRQSRTPTSSSLAVVHQFPQAHRANRAHGQIGLRLRCRERSADVVVFHLRQPLSAPTDRCRRRHRTFDRGPIRRNDGICSAIANPLGMPDRERDHQSHQRHHGEEPKYVAGGRHDRILARQPGSAVHRWPA
jgi:hypothetical protein